MDTPHDKQLNRNKRPGLTARHTAVIMLAVLLGQLLVALAFGNAKESYHLDEIYTYGLANSYYQPFLRWDDVSLTWHSPDFYSNYLTVQEDQRFAFKSVYYNLAHDNHPPLYFYGIHAVCSFFPDIFSKWLGIGFNILVLLATVVLLYFLARLVINDRYLALLTSAAYGFSAGAVSNTIFIRMYMLLTFFAVFTTYLHARLLLKPGRSLPLLLAIVVASILGFLTHYFFIIYAFFLAAGYMLYQWKQRNYPCLFRYVVAMGGSLLGAIILFPECLGIILGGSMGTQVIGNVTTSGGLDRVTAFGSFVAQGLFGGATLFVIIILIFLALIAAALLKYRGAQGDFRCRAFYKTLLISIWSYSRQAWLIIMLVAVSLTFLVIAKISPYSSQRYIAFLFPQITVLALLIGYEAIHSLTRNRHRTQMAITVLVVLCTLVSYCNGSVNYLYRSKADNLEQLMSIPTGYRAYCLTPRNYNITIAIPLLMQHQSSCYVSIDDPARDIGFMAAAAGSQKEPAVVYIPRWQDKGPPDQEIMDVIIGSGLYTSYQQIFTGEQSGLTTAAYLIN